MDAYNLSVTRNALPFMEVQFESDSEVDAAAKARDIVQWLPCDAGFSYKLTMRRDVWFEVDIS